MALLASPDVGIRGRAFLKDDPTEKARRERLFHHHFDFTLMAGSANRAKELWSLLTTAG